MTDVLVLIACMHKVYLLIVEGLSFIKFKYIGQKNCQKVDDVQILVALALTIIEKLQHFFINMEHNQFAQYEKKTNGSIIPILHCLFLYFLLLFPIQGCHFFNSFMLSILFSAYDTNYLSFENNVKIILF